MKVPSGSAGLVTADLTDPTDAKTLAALDGRMGAEEDELSAVLVTLLAGFSRI